MVLTPGLCSKCRATSEPLLGGMGSGQEFEGRGRLNKINSTRRFVTTLLRRVAATR